MLPEYPEALELDEAYRIQHQVTAALASGNTGGIKAGVTTEAAQQFFGLNHALIASLYGDGRRSAGCTIPYLAGRTLECEVAVLVDAEGEPTAIAPAIETVLLNFARPEDLTAANLVACNLAAELFIVGEFIPWSGAFADLSMQLKRDGEKVNQAEMNDALGGPAKAAQWMWHEAQKRGFCCGEQTLLMTGACGATVPAEAGEYLGEYGPLGELRFTIGE